MPTTSEFLKEKLISVSLCTVIPVHTGRCFNVYKMSMFISCDSTGVSFCWSP